MPPLECDCSNVLQGFGVRRDLSVSATPPMTKAPPSGIDRCNCSPSGTMPRATPKTGTGFMKTANMSVPSRSGTQEIPNSISQRVQILDLTFPDGEDAPSHPLELGFVAFVARGVLFEFGIPEIQA